MHECFMFFFFFNFIIKTNKSYIFILCSIFLYLDILFLLFIFFISTFFYNIKIIKYNLEMIIIKDVLLKNTLIIIINIFVF